MKKLISFTIFLALGLLFSPYQSHALTISPPKFILSADPGETITTKIWIRNDSNSTETLYPIFEAYTTRGGEEPVFFPAEFGLPVWIETDPTEITLGSKESATVSIIIKVPKDAEPGGHYAVIFWSSAPPQKEGTGIAITTRVGALVLLDVSGNVITLGEIARFGTSKKLSAHLPVSFSYDLKNTGNVHLRPEGKLIIKNIFGRTSAILEVNPQKSYVLPGTTRTFDVANWEPEGGMPKIDGEGFFPDLKRELKGFAFGYYKANLSLEYGVEEIKTAQASLSFWVLPWRILTLAVLILAILLFGITKGIKKYNEWVIDRVEERIMAKRKTKE